MASRGMEMGEKGKKRKKRNERFFLFWQKKSIFLDLSGMLSREGRIMMEMVALINSITVKLSSFFV